MNGAWAAKFPYADELRRGFFLHSGIKQQYHHVKKDSFRHAKSTGAPNTRFQVCRLRKAREA